MSKTIWLVNPYGPVPSEAWREYRYTIFGKELAKAGWKVIWWTSNFSHHFKNYRSKGWKDEQISEGFIIRYVPTTSYKKNFGFGRLLKDIVFSINMHRRACECEKPDVIIAAENPICMGWPGFHYSKKSNVKIIYDQMDLWPEFIEESVSTKIKKMTHCALIPVYKRRNLIYNQLDGMIGLGKNYLQFALDKSETLNNKPHVCIYNGIYVDESRRHMKGSYDKLPLKKENEIWCIFAGTLGVSYDIPTILDVSKKMMDDTNIKFLIAGNGPYLDLVKETAHKQTNLIYLGKVKPQELFPIYSKCDIGLMTYSKKSNVDMPDKMYDYTAAGLAIINSLTDEAKSVVEAYECGVNYQAEDCESLYNAIVRLASNKEYLAKAKKNSSDVGSKYDIKMQMDALSKLLTKIVSIGE